MPHRSVFGWLLAGAFCASVSCSGGSGGVPGFGVACESAKDCEGYKLICGSDAKCVQCVTENNCKDAQICSTGLCKTEVHCESAKDCSGSGLLCNADTKVCVDCLVSHDCRAGQICAKNVCGDRPHCDFTSECGQSGLVCDMGAHVCVACRDDNDCGFRRVCVDYDCVSESSAGEGGAGSAP